MISLDDAWDVVRAVSPIGSWDTAVNIAKGDFDEAAVGMGYQIIGATALVKLDHLIHHAMTRRWAHIPYNWGPRLSFSGAMAAPKRTMLQRVATHGVVGAYAPLGVAGLVAASGYAHIKATEKIGIHNPSGEGFSLPVTQEGLDFFGFR